MDSDYGVILADPPWKYKTWSGTPYGNGSRTADSHYKGRTMTVEEICEMRPMVQDWAAKNCALFMWATLPALDDARRVMDWWGFRYKTVALAWVKLNAKALSPKALTEARAKGLPIIEYGGALYTPRVGLGHYTRGNEEWCLLGVRGSMPVRDKGVRQTVFAPLREHSRKPDEQYGLIERLYPEGDRVELFARHERAGWDCWGDEV